MLFLSQQPPAAIDPSASLQNLQAVQPPKIFHNASVPPLITFFAYAVITIHQRRPQGAGSQLSVLNNRDNIDQYVVRSLVCDGMSGANK